MNVEDLALVADRLEACRVVIDDAAAADKFDDCPHLALSRHLIDEVQTWARRELAKARAEPGDRVRPALVGG